MALMPLDLILKSITRSPFPMCTKFKVGETYKDNDTAYASAGSTWTVLSTAGAGDFSVVAQRQQDNSLATFTPTGIRRGYVNNKANCLKPQTDKIVLKGKLYKNPSGWEYHAYTQHELIKECTSDIRNSILHTIEVEVPRE